MADSTMTHSSQKENDFGFIITRHVNSEKTNKYWNTCVKCIRRLYPFKKIVIIDDYSDPIFLKADHDYNNVLTVYSEYRGRGELLPYYYYYKNRYFENAVILHDSVFFHKRFPFEKLQGVEVLPLWHFNRDREDLDRMLNISNVLNYRYMIQKKITLNDNVLGMPYEKWYGCFGVQCYIRYSFLHLLMKKYELCKLLNVVRCRKDRCCVERIFGILFASEYPRILKQKSVWGDIFHYQHWGYSYEDYEKDVRRKILPRYVVKVWTGR